MVAYGPGAENEAEFGTGLAHADRLDIHEQVIPGKMRALMSFYIRSF
jgi:hypothetical protein